MVAQTGSLFKSCQKRIDTIRTVLYIMDRYCLSDSAYHEMTVIVDGLPRSYVPSKTMQEIIEFDLPYYSNPGKATSSTNEF